MVVQIAAEIQLPHRLIDHGHAGGASAHIVWQRLHISIVWQHAFLQVLQDIVA